MRSIFSNVLALLTTYLAQRFRLPSPALMLALAILVLWQLTLAFKWIPQYLLPSPWEILTCLIAQHRTLGSHFLATATISLCGLAIGLLFATLTSLLMAHVYAIKKALYPWLAISQAIPIIFIYPLLLLWFGFGYAPKIIVVSLICFFPIAINLIDALTQRKLAFVRALQSMGAKPLPLLLHVRFMFALPAYISGIRLATSYCVVGAVISEWLGASQGLGVYMLRSYKSFQTDQVFAAIFCTIALTLLLLYALRRLEHFFLPWLRRTS